MSYGTRRRAVLSPDYVWLLIYSVGDRSRIPANRLLESSDLSGLAKKVITDDIYKPVAKSSSTSSSETTERRPVAARHFSATQEKTFFLGDCVAVDMGIKRRFYGVIIGFAGDNDFELFSAKTAAWTGGEDREDEEERDEIAEADAIAGVDRDGQVTKKRKEMKVHVQWLLARDELPNGWRVCYDHNRELFASEETEWLPLSSLDHVISIVSPTMYENMYGGGHASPALKSDPMCYQCHYAVRVLRRENWTEKKEKVVSAPFVFSKFDRRNEIERWREYLRNTLAEKAREMGVEERRVEEGDPGEGQDVEDSDEPESQPESESESESEAESEAEVQAEGAPTIPPNKQRITTKRKTAEQINAERMAAEQTTTEPKKTRRRKVKRPVGRPRKVPLEGEVAPPTTVKRGPGRPRKDGTITPAVKRGPGRPRKDATATEAVEPVKRGPGRPRKSVSTEPLTPTKSRASVDPRSSQKRGPGRPRKHPLPEASSLATPEKRKVGRPRKTEEGVEGTPRKRKGSEILTTPRKREKLADNDSPGSEFRTPKKQSFTPLPRRMFDTPTQSSPVTPHVVARSRLHVAAAPEALPCREREFEEIQTALESAIMEETGSCVYVSGTPGTGKTATVRSVVRFLKEHFDFQFVEINGMKITQPTHAYEMLWEAISGKNTYAGYALRFLDEEFSGAPKLVTKPVVVLMDELDQLVTKSQDVMYNFFNWPSLPDSKLIVVAIANIMDLPERTLSNKISSRLGLTRIQFAGYTHQQLQVIVEERLKGVQGNIVAPEAIEFASRKVASVTGDARRALDICRRAVELSEQESVPAISSTTATDGAQQQRAHRVTIQHIRKAINETTSSPVVQFLSSLPLTCKMILVALIQRAKISGVAENSVDSVLEVMNLKLRNFGGLAAYEGLLFGPTDAYGQIGVNGEEEVGYRAQTKKYVPGEVLLGTAVRVSDGPVTRVRGFERGIAELVESGVLLQQNGRSERQQSRMSRIRLNIRESDVVTALKDDGEVGNFL